ncbi:MAG: heparin lyase I family protein [Actinomycetota bacterium]|nr:heparin lyase I family protein [Actinomycetota bacterium]MEE3257028.1 heparin lyase I family protein [Actinomycetota bacterium]
MTRRNHLTAFFVALLAVTVLGACSPEQTYPMSSIDPEVDAAMGVPLPDGTPCHELYEPARQQDSNGALLPGTHDGDLLSGWAFEMKQPTGFKDHGCQIVTAPHPVRNGSYSFRFEVRDGDCNSYDGGWDDCTNDRSRHELSQTWRPEAVYGQDLYPNRAGDEFWYSWSMWLPPKSLQQGKTSTFIGQFNSDNSARFYLRDFGQGQQPKDGFGYVFNDRNYDLISQDILASNPGIRGRWVDIMMHVIWSEGDTGLIELYIDGDITEILTGPNMDGATRTTFDFGIYNAFISKCRCDVMLTQHMYFDEIRRGTTREDVEISPDDPDEVEATIGELLGAPTSTVTYVEGGGYDFWPYSLTYPPTGQVVVRFEALDPTEVALSDQAVVEIVVTAENWEMFGPSWRAPQDGIEDGDQTTKVRVSVIAERSDEMYGHIEDQYVSVISVDRAPSADDH